MGRCITTALLAFLVGLTGCRTDGPPSDPLFETRKPVEVKAQTQPPMPVPHADIRPPTDPYKR